MIQTCFQTHTACQSIYHHFVAPIRIDISIGQSNIGNESQTCMKRDRPVGSKDKNHQTKKGIKMQDD